MSFFSWVGFGENFEKADPQHRAEVLLKKTSADSERARQLKNSLKLMSANISMSEKLREAETVRRNDSLVWLNLILALHQEDSHGQKEGLIVLRPTLPDEVKDAKLFAAKHPQGGGPGTLAQDLALSDRQIVHETLTNFWKAVEKQLKPIFNSGFQELNAQKPVAPTMAPPANDNHEPGQGEVKEAA